jgi:succinate dehydrogenase / fumarate reductase, cytochrome b subunit
MSSAAETVDSSTHRDATFVRARLGSLLAFLPLGVWSIGHLWNNLSAFQGGDKWSAAVTQYPHPVAQLATGVVVLVPLVLHVLWGIGRITSSQPNNQRYGYFANLKYLLQRVSAVGLLLFIGAHMWLAMLHPRLTTGHPEPFAELAQEMHFHTPTLIVYLLGTLGLAYHLANGIHTFCMGWGVVTSRKALRNLNGFVVLLFGVFLAMGWGAIYAIFSAVA